MFNEKNIARLMDIATAACHVGLVLDARVVFNAILEAKKDFAPAKLGLAYSYLVIDQFEQATALTQEVLDADPNDTDAIGLLGFCCYLAGDKEQATTLLEPLNNCENAQAKQLAQDILSA